MAKKQKGSDKSTQKIIMYVVIATMVLSALYMETRTEERTQVNFNLTQYDVESIGNATALITIKAPLNEWVAVPASVEAVDRTRVESILGYNSSNITEIRCEVTNAYLLFRFKSDNDVSGEIDGLLDSELGRYTLYRVYVGSLGGRDVSVAGSMNLHPGDYVKGVVMQKVSSDSEELISFQQKILVAGPKIPANVIGVGEYQVYGNVNPKEDLDKALSKINVTDKTLKPITIVSGKISVNAAEALHNINATVYVDGENTTIEMDAYRKDVEDILERENVTYVMQDREIMFWTPNSMEDVVNAFRNVNATIEIMREGFVSTADEMVYNGKAVKIDQNENYSVMLNTNTKVGENITIEVGVLQIGDQTIAFRAKQV